MGFECEERNSTPFSVQHWLKKFLINSKSLASFRSYLQSSAFWEDFWEFFSFLIATSDEWNPQNPNKPCLRPHLLSTDAAYESFLRWTLPSENKVGLFIKFIYLFFLFFLLVFFSETLLRIFIYLYFMWLLNWATPLLFVMCFLFTKSDLCTQTKTENWTTKMSLETWCDR